MGIRRIALKRNTTNSLAKQIDHQLRDLTAALDRPRLLFAAAGIFAFLAICFLFHPSSNVRNASIDAFPPYAHIEGFDP
jgi:hypothetical protein